MTSSPLYIHVHQFRLLAEENKVFLSALTSALGYPTMDIHVYFRNAKFSIYFSNMQRCTV